LASTAAVDDGVLVVVATGAVFEVLAGTIVVAVAGTVVVVVVAGTVVVVLLAGTVLVVLAGTVAVATGVVVVVVPTACWASANVGPVKAASAAHMLIVRVFIAQFLARNIGPAENRTAVTGLRVFSRVELKKWIVIRRAIAQQAACRSRSSSAATCEIAAEREVSPTRINKRSNRACREARVA
jgi:hypothetical protein